MKHRKRRSFGGVFRLHIDCKNVIIIVDVYKYKGGRDDIMITISAIVPCYNEEAALPLFYEEICRVQREAKTFELEMIFVDDGSKDATLSLLRELARKDARVRYISFTRNFGKESAMLAGLRAATGDYTALLDADLQDPPSLLPEMLDILEKNHGEYDIVATRRSNRAGEPPVRSFFARKFYQLINKISDTEIVDGARDFRLMHRRVVQSILELTEYNRFSKGIFSWVGYKTHWISYENRPRAAGETKWNFWKLLLYSVDGIVAFSTKPLAIASLTGLGFCFLAFLFLVFIFLRALIWGDPVAGWPSTICIVVLIGGIQLFCIGILGQYLAKTYMETKRRPVFLVRETEGGEK